MSMHHEIARLEEENRQLRMSNNQLRISRQWEVEEIRRKREEIRYERERIEYAADRISATEAATAERERKNNIREKLVQEAKMVGKVHGLAAFSKLFNQGDQIGQNNTNVQSVEAAPETPVLPSAEVPFDKMIAWEKERFVKNLVRQALEGQKIK